MSPHPHPLSQPLSPRAAKPSPPRSPSPSPREAQPPGEGEGAEKPNPLGPRREGEGAEKPNRHEVERVVAPLSRQVGFSGAGRGDGGEGSTPTTPGAPMAGIFKAYDVRGTVPDQVNPAIARQIGLAFQHVLDADDRALGNQVVVSRDMRSHSEGLAEALIDGLLSTGLDVLDIGLATTPMNYFAIGHFATAGGIQVTASHNPAKYNGFKFSRHGARPVSGDHGIALMERKIAEGDLPEAATRGTRTKGDVAEAYQKHILSFLRPEGRERKLKVAADAGNGMVVIERPILEAAGIELIPLYFELDGTFPNHEANPLKEENLVDIQKLVRASGADLGIAFDGDSDRAAFVDETGDAIGSDLMTGLIAG